MNRFKKYAAGILCLLVVLSGCGERERINILAPDGSSPFSVMDFSKITSLDPLPDGWFHRTFWFTSPMDISFGTKEGRQAIKLATDNSASMLFRHVDIPLDDYPRLEWDWYIEQGVQSTISELTEDGDDHPARLFLSFEGVDGTPHRMEIIWGNVKLKPGEWKHLDMGNGHSFPHYVANSGRENTRRWQDERVDMTELYNELWGDAAGARLTDIALFCDTDGTGAKSIAYFSKVQVSRGE